jgi:hypothetical protein
MRPEGLGKFKKSPHPVLCIYYYIYIFMHILVLAYVKGLLNISPSSVKI